MKALIFNDKLEYKTDVPLPVRTKGESLIRIQVAGICRTDLEITKGYMGFSGIPGHEFTGIVEESENHDLIGKRVVGEINCACNSCKMCRMGLQKHCPNRSTLGIFKRNGAFAEYITLPDENLHIIPDNVSNKTAVFAEPLAAAFEISISSHISPEDRILQIGDGKLGLLTAQVISGFSSDFLVTGRHRDNLAFLENLNVKTCLSHEFKPEGRYDKVIECSGSFEGFELACSLVRPRGEIILKSTYAGAHKVDLSMLVVDEIRIITSRCGPFAPALRALENGSISVMPLIGAEFNVDEGLKAFETAEKIRKKVLINFE